MNIQQFSGAILALGAVFLLGGCLSASPFQSARVVDEGHTQSVVSVQRTVDADEGMDDDGGWTMAEFTVRRPLGEESRSDWAFSGALVHFDESPGLGGMVGAAMKHEFVSDHLALEMPIRVMLIGAGIQYSTHIYPRLIGTIDLHENVELNLVVTRFIYLAWLEGSRWGLSAGLGIGKRDGYMVRPEFGVLYDPDLNTVYQLGVGLEVNEMALLDTSAIEETPR